MLTAAQKQFFDDQGYLVVPDVLDQKTVLDPVRAEYSDLLDRLYDAWHAEGKLPPPGDIGFWDKLLSAYKAKCDWFQPFDISLPGDKIQRDTPFHIGQAVLDMVTTPALLDIVESLIGPEITSNPIQHVRIKPPASDLQIDEVRAHITATDWHQDRGVTLENADQTEMITVWIAVTDATEENGCLTVQPGAHKGELLPHCEKTQLGIPDRFVDQATAKNLPVTSGGIILFHPKTPHASLVNQTDRFRWSFDIRYNVSGQPTGRDHFPDFVARSASHPETELRDAEIWRDMWLEARARLAAGPYIKPFRWDSNAPVCA